MAIDITGQLSEQQEIAIALGTQPVSSLIICTGKAPLELSSAERNFVFSIGPPLSRNQFLRAIASGGFATLTINTPPQPAMMVDGTALGSPGGTQTCGIQSIDADWDDELNRVRVRLEMTQSPGGMSPAPQITVINYTVHIVTEA
jgi:hypothetical protein